MMEDKKAFQAEHAESISDEKRPKQSVSVLAHLTESQVFADVERFCLDHGFENDIPLFKRAARVAHNPHEIATLPDLSDEERRICIEETTHKWRHPIMMYLTIFICSIGAATQGWDQTGVSLHFSLSLCIPISSRFIADTNQTELYLRHIVEQRCQPLLSRSVRDRGQHLAHRTHQRSSLPSQCRPVSPERSYPSLHRTIPQRLTYPPPYCIFFDLFPTFTTTRSGCWISDPLNWYLGRRMVIFLTALCLIATPISSGFAKSWGCKSISAAPSVHKQVKREDASLIFTARVL
jgi:hypothetical protein